MLISPRMKERRTIQTAIRPAKRYKFRIYPLRLTIINKRKHKGRFAMQFVKKKIAGLLAIIMVILPSVPEAAAIQFSASAAYVMDADTGETLYEYNADVRRTPASMTKVLTSYIVFQELEKGTLTLDTDVPVSSHARAISYDSSYPLSVPLTQSSYPLNTLLTLLHVPSASGAAVALAEKVSGSESAFVERMNKTAKELGLDAQYYCVHGCGPNKITARSQAKLTQHFIHTYPDVLKYTSQSSVYFEGNTYNNGNKLLGSYEGCDGFKTGTYDDSGYCLDSTAVRNGRRVIAIAMNASNNSTRISDSATLLNEGFRVLAERDAARTNTAISLATDHEKITHPYEPVHVVAKMSGIEHDYNAPAQWYVNGKAIAGYGNQSFHAHNGVVSTFQYLPTPQDGDHLDVSFVVTLPGNVEKKASYTIPVGEAVKLSGYINPDYITGYPSVRISAKIAVTAQPAVSLLLPAEWQLDGQTISGATTKTFSIVKGKTNDEFSFQLSSNTASGLRTLSCVIGKGTPSEIKMDCQIVIRQPGEDIEQYLPKTEEPAPTEQSATDDSTAPTEQPSPSDSTDSAK